ncbi:hypothetical protein MTO96_016058 [Rhipicephalus appendiculatus]
MPKRNTHTRRLCTSHLDIDGDVAGFLSNYGTFQRVYSFKTLHWSRDLHRSLGNIAQLLAPGGECLLVFLGRSFLFESFKKISRIQPWSKYADVKSSLIANPIFSLLSEEEKTAFQETLSTHQSEWHDLYCKTGGPILWSAFLVHARKP